jgi:hypothetical protein
MSHPPVDYVAGGPTDSKRLTGAFWWLAATDLAGRRSLSDSPGSLAGHAPNAWGPLRLKTGQWSSWLLAWVGQCLDTHVGPIAVEGRAAVGGAGARLDHSIKRPLPCSWPFKAIRSPAYSRLASDIPEARRPARNPDCSPRRPIP